MKKQSNLKYKSREEAIQDHKKNYRSQGIAKGKGEYNSPDRIRIEKITDSVKLRDVVLDVACNDGLLSCAAIAKGAVVYGVDVVEELVNLAQDRGVLARVGCAEKLEFANEYFDVVMAGEILEHLFDPHEAIQEIVRVLRPNGVFVGSVPHYAGPLGIGKHADYHQRVFRQNELKYILQKYFEDVNMTETPYHPDFCKEFNLSETAPTWVNFECRRKR